MDKEDKSIPKEVFDEETFKQINYLYTYALLFTGDEQKAEKVLYKTYQKAFWFFEYLSTETDIKTWLHRIMMNIFRNDRSYTGKAPVEHLQDIRLVINYKLLEKSRSFAFTNKLVNSISKLPVDMKESFILKDVLGFNSEQTADLVDIPEGTITKRLFDARRTIFINIEYDKNTVPVTDQIPYEYKKKIAILAEEASGGEPGREILQKYKDEIEAQKIIIALIKKHIPIQILRQAVQLKIVKKFAPALLKSFKGKTGQERNRMVAGATILMILLIIFMIIFRNDEIVNPGELASMQKGENNALLILKKSYADFEEGKFENHLLNTSIDSLFEVQGDNKENEKPFIVEIPGWKLTAAFNTEISDSKILHFVYNNQNRKLFGILFPLKLLTQQKALSLSEELFQFLDSGKCFAINEKGKFYLLKKQDRYITGYASKQMDKSLIVEICNQRRL